MPVKEDGEQEKRAQGELQAIDPVVMAMDDAFRVSAAA